MSLGLLGALGGLGQGMSAYGQQMAKDASAVDAEARQRSIEEWRLQKQEEYQINREERAAATQEAGDKRNADMTIRSREGADSALKDRGFADFKAKLGATEMGEDELRKVYESQYHDKRLGDFAGADQFEVGDVSRKTEELNQLQGMGAGSGLLKAGAESVKSAKQDEKSAAAAQRQARIDEDRRVQDKLENERKDKKDARDEVMTDARVKALVRSGSGGGSGTSGVREALSFVDNSRKALSSEATEVRRLMDAEMDNARTPNAKTAVKERYATTLKAIEDRRKELDGYFSQLAPRVGLTAPEASPVNPNAGQSTSGVKPPAAGAVQGGYRFKGGDPSKQSNWEKVK